MGNIPQFPIQTKPIETSKTEDKTDISLINEDIFIKILNISNDLLMEYNDDFLKEDFCNKLALIYEKKLSKFNIKILKSLYDNINSNKVDNNLITTIQYIPKDDDKFLVDIFKNSLNENFWKKNVELISGTISDNSEIESYIKYTPNYISLKHVNHLLNSLKEKEIITPPEDIKVGGQYNINSFKKQNNKRYTSNTNLSNEISFNNGLEEKSSNNRLQEKSFNKEKSSNNGLQEKSSNKVNSSNNRLQEKSPNNGLQEKSSNNGLQEKSSNNKVNSSNKELSLEDINKTTNNLIIKNSINVNKEIIDDKLINDLIKYSVPNYYKEPANFCNNKEKCELTKKQLCQSISENFIVRNNIIAAILTTIPYKNENGEYEGGICYQKFMNLEKCHVCVPYDYNELKDKDIKDVLTKILEKASYLNKNQCRDNNGYFLTLSGEQKKNIG